MQDELTLKELILALQDYLYYFLRKWYWFLIGALLLGGGLFYSAYTQPVTYTAPLTFLINNNSDKSSGAGAILGNIGLGGPEAGGGTATKLLELSRSRRVLGLLLFDSATVDGNTQMIADHLIEYLDYHELWAESERLTGFKFNGQRPTEDDRLGNQVFKSLYRKMIREKEGVLSVEADELSGLFTILAVTPNAELSVEIAKKSYEIISGYFVNASVSSKRESLRLLTVRTDSVRQELSVAEDRLARFEDRTSRIPLRRESIKGQKLRREVGILNAMYIESMKNRETAAFLLANEKPGFELVDHPLEPLTATRGNWVSKTILGVALGIILVGIILFFRKLIKDAMV